MKSAERLSVLRAAVTACREGRHGDGLTLALALLPHAPGAPALRRTIVVAAAGDGGGARIRQAAASLERHGAHGEALTLLEALVERDVHDAVAWNQLGNLRQRLGRQPAAEAAYRAALATGASDPTLRARLGICLARQDRPDEAVDATEAALAAAPGDLWLRWTDARVLPVSYRDAAGISRWRQRYLDRMQGVASAAEGAGPDAAAALLERAWNGFQAHYPCLPADVELQRPLGRTLRALARAAWPDLDGARPVGGPKLRVGFVSALLRQHTVGRLFGGWVRDLDRDRFHVELWHLGAPDAVTRSLGESCDRFEVRPFADTAGTARALRDAGLDVLIYPELGMDVPTLRLAALRLAPVQAMSWGHPVTSALPTIDAFLSSAAMEPPDGERFVTESLVRLPGLGLALQPLAPGPGVRTRADFGLPDDAVVYVNTQSAFKLLPQADAAVVRIAREVPGAVFVFLGGAGVSGGGTLRARLSDAFAAAGLDAAQQLRFLDALSHADFLDLNGIADVFLDGLHWSGGWTTLEALSCGAVPVTLPGALMRTRHTAGILWELGVTDTVAADEDGFVDIAVRLGRETAWRAALAERLATALPRLWADRRGLAALEDWLLNARAVG